MIPDYGPVLAFALLAVAFLAWAVCIDRDW